MMVWKDSSVNGTLLMALIAQLIVSLIIVDMKGTETKKNVRGKMVIRTVRPAPSTAVRSLGQLTVTYISLEGRVKDRVFSNFDPINTKIMGILDHIERFPERKKVGNKATVDWPSNDKFLKTSGYVHSIDSLIYQDRAKNTEKYQIIKTQMSKSS